MRVVMRVIGAYEKKNLLLVDMGWTACSKQGEEKNFGRIEDHPELKVVNLKQEVPRTIKRGPRKDDLSDLSNSI